MTGPAERRDDDLIATVRRLLAGSCLFTVAEKRALDDELDTFELDSLRKLRWVLARASRLRKTTRRSPPRSGRRGRAHDRQPPVDAERAWGHNTAVRKGARA